MPIMVRLGPGVPHSMSTEHTPEHLTGLISELRRLPAETGWVEFKQNFVDPSEIGEYISALSNAAALVRKPSAYLVWGIQDGNRDARRAVRP